MQDLDKLLTRMEKQKNPCLILIDSTRLCNLFERITRDGRAEEER